MRWLILSVGCWTAMTVCADQELLSPQQAAQLGLIDAWHRQLSVPAGKQSIRVQELRVHQTDPNRYVEIIGAASEGSPATVYSRIQIDSSPPLTGVIDQAEAERLARNEIRRLKRRGITAETKILEVARVRLYTLSDDGTLECRDAETGDLVWLVRVGDRDRGYSGLGVDDQFVTVLNGGELLKLDAKNGQQFETLKLAHVPLPSAVHCGGKVIVPSIGNRVEVYSLVDPLEDPFVEIVSGAGLSSPTKATDANKLAWGTANGFVYVMELDGKPNVQFRLDTDGIVTGKIAAADGQRFFFGSEGGQIYGLRATRSGDVLWSRPTGEAIYDEPVVSGNQVLFRTVYGNVHSVSTTDGYGTWNEPVAGIEYLMGVFKDHIYARSLSGSLAVLSLKDGSMIAMLPGTNAKSLFVNQQTDRLYLINRAGTVQCLREEDAVLPTFTSAPDVVKEPETMDKPKTPPANDLGEPGLFPDDSEQPGILDPFAAPGNDPFAPAGGGNDPFGGDPFGGNDPFGN